MAQIISPLNICNSNATGGYSNNAFGYSALGSNTSGNQNSAFGDAALTSLTTGTNNCGFGDDALGRVLIGHGNSALGGAALANNLASFNNALGYIALYKNTSGYANVAIGTAASYSNTTGAYNMAFGDSALQTNTTGNFNSAFGYKSLYSNTTASDNFASGYKALYSNSTGTKNVAVGNSSLYNDVASYNNALGYGVLYSSNGVVAHYNNGFGYTTLYNNTTGTRNSGFGHQAIYHNINGTDNTGIGYTSLYVLTSGIENTAVGAYAGQTLTTGSDNTLLGYGADVVAACSTASNMTAIGSGAIVSNATNHGANSMQFGNSSVAYIWSSATYNTVSDGRFKDNVAENVKGLTFINKLRPVTYNINTKRLDDFIIQDMPDSIKQRHQQGMDFVQSTNIVHSGFIAQEVAQAAQQSGFASTIVTIPDDVNKGHYGVNYAEFVVPLVKAVQELSKTVDSLKALLIAPSSGNRSMNNGNINSNENKNSTTAIHVELSNINAIVLNQNVPNPFAEQTVITYNVPPTTTNAQILFYDSDGKLIKSVDITSSGKGQLNVFANDLSSGVYSYALLIDGKVYDTKKMMKQ